MRIFGFNITERLHGRWCRFFIHRYLGQFLEKKLSLDQLSLDLSGGCIDIEQVMLNAQYINEQLSTLNMPLRLVDGFIGSIKIKVPWNQLMSDSSQVFLSDVQLTFRATDAFKIDDKDLVSSMLGSMVESIVSSMDIAQSFCKEEKEDGEWDEDEGDNSVHALSKIIDVLLSRFCCRIDDLILRVEADAVPNSDMSTAMELKITRFDFMDEQMRTLKQEGKNAETITSQPHGFASVTDLSKSLYVSGVSLYTDTFSKADLPCYGEGDTLSPVTSMYLRREHKKSLQAAGSPLASMYASANMAESSMTNTFYQSCYSNMGGETLSADFKSVRPEPALMSNPVKFAEIAGEVKIVIKIKNSDIKSSEKLDKKVEFEVFATGMSILVTPSQIDLIRRLSALLIPVDDRTKKKLEAGQPMEDTDFDVVNRQLDNMTGEVPRGNALGRLGNWQGVEDFRGFASISLNNDNDNVESLHPQRPPAPQPVEMQAASKTETAVLRLNLSNLLLFVTHDDPLNVDNVAGLERGAHDAIDTMHHNSKRFFDRAPAIKFYGNNLEPTLAQGDYLYPKDHLRLIGTTVIASYNVQTGKNGEQRISTKFVVGNCDIAEFLTAESTMDKKPIHNPILKFERKDGDSGTNFTVHMQVEGSKSMTTVHLGKCISEFDMSLSDRISELLYPRPFFNQPSKCYKPPVAPSGLNEDLFADVVAKEAHENTIDINCANWTLDIMIPKVDLRMEASDGPAYNVRNVHDEKLRLKMTSCRVVLPPQKRDGPKTIEITAMKVIGYFLGDLAKLNCTEEDAAFLFGGASKMVPVKIELEFDGRNKSLKNLNSSVYLPHGVDDMAKSFSAEMFKSLPKRDGPFAKTNQSFTRQNAHESDDENIVRAGSREEMAAFAKECMAQSDVTLRISIPILKMQIPNHQFLELLYNRIVNDFALWQPRSPALKQKDIMLNVPLDDFKEMQDAIVGRQLSGQLNESDDEETQEEFTRGRERQYSKTQSHCFSLEMDVHMGTLVLGTEMVLEPDTTPILGQLAGELKETQLFVCYGFHGDVNQTFFHMTTTDVCIAQRNRECTIPKNVLAKDFGTHRKEEVHLKSLPEESHLRENRHDDSLAVALHLVTSDDARVKETTAAISLRLLEMPLIPVRRMEEWWIMQLKDLFNLVDYDIPGYEMPIVNTYLHIHLDHAVVSHDHSIINKDSNVHYKLLLGNVDINSTLVPSMKVNKFLFLLERIHLHMRTGEEEEGGRTVKYEDECEEALPSSNMVHIMEIGLLQFELLVLNQLMSNAEEKRRFPQLDVRCQNDQIKVWVCHDSLVTLINTIVEVVNCDLWKVEEKEGTVVDEDETRDEMEESTDTRSTMRRTTAESISSAAAQAAEERVRRLMENACQETPMSSLTPPESKTNLKRETRVTGIAYGWEALEEFGEENNFDENLMDDAMRDINFGTPPKRSGMRTISGMSTDEEFFMVEDIVGCGITSSSGEPRIRVLDPDDNSTENGGFYLEYVPEHISHSGDLRADNIPLPANFPAPIYRYSVKDISIQFHFYAGNDLGRERDTVKSYSADEYREGMGKGQVVLDEARGGPYRDHSACVIIELNKISYLHQLFENDSPARSMNFISVQDVTIHDRLTLSNIKEMLYQYATSDKPRRTCAPMLAIRMVENHQQEGKLRVSMLPIRLNVDQDTLEFIEDFVASVSKGISLPTVAFPSRPVVEVVDGYQSDYNMERPDILPPQSPPLPSSTPLLPTPSPRPPGNDDEFLYPRLSILTQKDELDDLLSAPPSASPLPAPSPMSSPPVRPVSPDATPVAPPRRTRPPYSPEEEFIDELMPLEQPPPLFSPLGGSPDLCPLGGDESDDYDEPRPQMSDLATKSIFDMRNSLTEAAHSSDAAGDWGSNSEIKFSRHEDSVLARSTMNDSIYAGQDEDDEEEAEGSSANFFDDDSSESPPPPRATFLLDESTHDGPLVDMEEDEEREDGQSTMMHSAAPIMHESVDRERVRGQTFFKEFIFAPEMTIFIDYHGKNKYNMEKAGAMLAVLKGMGQLNRTAITLRAIEHRNGLLGVGRCVSFAFDEWQENVMANLSGVLSSVGPISPLVQIGKGICDLFWMPVAEMRKEDGHVVKGIQRGAGSFGFSTAAAVVDIAQRLVGVVQVAAESVLYEMTPDHPALNNRNRRPITNRHNAPQDVRHGVQLAYDLIAEGVQQTRMDIELATQEDRASGRSSMRSVLRYATPTFLRPFVITSQISYHLLGGLKNQLRPDEFHDEQHKWRTEKDRPSGSK